MLVSVSEYKWFIHEQCDGVSVRQYEGIIIFVFPAPTPARSDWSETIPMPALASYWPARSGEEKGWVSEI